MSRMNKKKRFEMDFFLNRKGRIAFNRLCLACVHSCKQSHRAIVIICPKYKSKRSE